MNKDSNSRPIIKHKKEDFIKINKKIDPKNKKMNSGKLTFENKIKNRKKKDVIKNTFYRGPHRPTANSFFFDNNRSNYKENLPELKNFEQQGKKKNNEPFFNQDKFLEEQKNLSKISYNLFPKKKTNKTENLDHVQKQNNLKRKKLNLLNKLRKGLMKQGKQATANKIIKTCCSLIKFRDGVKPLDLIYESICNVKPLVELEKKSKTNFSKKKSRAVPIVPKRGFKLAVE
jgi:ribosomal protein S7